MTLRDDVAAAEIVDGVRAARTAAHELVEERLAKGKARLRSTSKTRKSARTRERIMSAASELMMERGNTNFQMSEVSERCHLSKGSLYYYFRDKDELIAAIFDELVDDLVSDIEALVARAATAREALHALYAEFTRRLRAGSPLALAMTYELAGSPDATIPNMTSHFSRATKVIAAQVERAKQEGFVRADVDSHVAATFATGGLLAMSLVVAGDRMADDADAVSAAALDLILHGMGGDGTEG